MQVKDRVRELITAARLCYKRGLICGTEGNFSVRVKPDYIITTGRGICKGFLTKKDLVVVDRSGQKIKSVLNNNRNLPSSELDMHLCVYEARSDVKAVLHAHPTTLVAFTVCGQDLNYEILPEIISQFKSIPVAKYATPGTKEVRQSIIDIIKDNDVVVLDHHGIIMLGENILDLYFKLEMLEHYAKTLFIAKILGEPINLPSWAVQKLIKTNF